MNYTGDSQTRIATCLDNTTKFMNPSKQEYQATNVDSIPDNDTKICSSILYSTVELN